MNRGIKRILLSIVLIFGAMSVVPYPSLASIGDDTTPPTSNSPPDASYVQGATATIGWILTDETTPGAYSIRSPGTYSVTKDGAPYIAPTAWTSGASLDVAVDTSAVGTDTYEISYTDAAGNAGTPDSVTVTVTSSSEVNVKIDIKPGSFPNSINLRNRGNVPVAILSDPTFDATTVDRSTVIFAGSSPLPIGKSPKDVNGDGLIDIVLHFKTRDLNLRIGDTEACLNGETFSGVMFQGCDSVRIVK